MLLKVIDFREEVHPTECVGLLVIGLVQSHLLAEVFHQGWWLCLCIFSHAEDFSRNYHQVEGSVIPIEQLETFTKCLGGQHSIHRPNHWRFIIHQVFLFAEEQGSFERGRLVFG